VKNFLRLLLGTACCCVASGAIAADMALPPSPQLGLRPSLTWTGCYVGGNIGGGWNTISGFDPTAGVSVGNGNGSGFVGGGQVGCDYQFNSIVVGVAGMFDGSAVSGTGPNLEVPGVTNKSVIPWLATLTGRIGFVATPSTLLYAKAGAAWAQDNISTTNISSPLVPVGPVSSSSYAASGWTVGGGLEYVFAPHWSVFVEYDYMDFGTSTRTFIDSPAAGGGRGPFNITQQVQTAVVGINFRY
jgi:outer membrane immunogenic protein